MSNLIYDRESFADIERVTEWAHANSMTPEDIFESTVFVEADVIRFRVAISPDVPELPEGSVRVGDEPYAEWGSPWVQVPLVKHPTEFGIGVSA